MFSGNPFYHGITKKAIVAFGNTFTGVTMKRDYGVNNGGVKDIVVPITYAQKEKWFVRLNEDPDFARSFMIDLPRMSFEITGFNYDPSRKIGQYKSYVLDNCPTNLGRIFSPVPWNINISLYTYTKTIDESLNILEQIIPFFSPSLVLNIEIIEPNITQDIPLTLHSINRTDNYEGSLEETRMIIQEFTFSMQLTYFGPTTSNAAIIKKTITDFNSQMGISVPPLETYQAAVNPSTANKFDVFTIDETWT